MATLLSLDFMNNFAGIFTFLLVFTLIFALLEYKKILGDHKGINGLVALSVAILVSMSKSATGIIAFAAPWFVVLFFFIIFILLAFTIFGAGEANFMAVLKGNNTVVYWIIAFAVIIAMVGMSNVLGPGLLSGGSGNLVTNDTATVDNTTSVATSDFQTNMTNTIFHPKVLGLVLVLIIGSFTIRLLAAKDT